MLKLRKERGSTEVALWGVPAAFTLWDASSIPSSAAVATINVPRIAQCALGGTVALVKQP